MTKKTADTKNMIRVVLLTVVLIIALITTSATAYGSGLHSSDANDDFSQRIEYEFTNLLVMSEWKAENSDSIPDYIEVYLTVNGMPSGEPVKLHPGNDWSFEWTSLIKEDGIIYGVKESTIPGFTATYTPGLRDNAIPMITITNVDAPPVAPMQLPIVTELYFPAEDSSLVEILDEDIPLSALPEDTALSEFQINEVLMMQFPNSELPVAGAKPTGAGMMILIGAVLLSLTGLMAILMGRNNKQNN